MGDRPCSTFATTVCGSGEPKYATAKPNHSAMGPRPAASTTRESLPVRHSTSPYRAHHRKPSGRVSAASAATRAPQAQRLRTSSRTLPNMSAISSGASMPLAPSSPW